MDDFDDPTFYVEISTTTKLSPQLFPDLAKLGRSKEGTLEVEVLEQLSYQYFGSHIAGAKG